MTQQQFNAAEEIRIMKQIMTMARQRRLMHSSLTKYRGEIVAFLKEGASFRLIANWLKRNKHLNVNHTSVMRFAKKLPELQQAEMQQPEQQLEIEEEGNHAELS
jgi:hypothetical protein